MTRIAAVLVAAAVLAATAPIQGALAETDESARDIWDPAWMWRGHTDDDDAVQDLEKRMLRHQTFMAGEIPEPYRSARNGLASTKTTVAEGRTLYLKHCARCHEEDGLGGGEAAEDLTPSPALLGFFIKTPMAVDPYLLWTITEGGAEFDTEMPAYKDVLGTDEIWKIVLFMRAGFPEAPGE